MLGLTESQNKVLEAIKARRLGNEITGAQIKGLTKIEERDKAKEGASVRAILNALRKKNYPICANDKGYYYPGSKTELDEYIGSLEGRIAKQVEALNGLKGASRTWETMTAPVIPPKPIDWKLRCLMHKTPDEMCEKCYPNKARLL